MLACRAGAALVPVFAFGQSKCYSYIKPGPPLLPARWVAAFARKIGFMPLIIWGEAFSPCPHPVRFTMAVAAAIDLPKIEHPSREQIQEHLDRFIEAMRSLFERRKSEGGFALAQDFILGAQLFIAARATSGCSTMLIQSIECSMHAALPGAVSTRPM